MCRSQISLWEKRRMLKAFSKSFSTLTWQEMFLTNSWMSHLISCPSYSAWSLYCLSKARATLYSTLFPSRRKISKTLTTYSKGKSPKIHINQSEKTSDEFSQCVVTNLWPAWQYFLARSPKVMLEASLDKKLCSMLEPAGLYFDPKFLLLPSFSAPSAIEEVLHGKFSEVQSYLGIGPSPQNAHSQRSVSVIILYPKCQCHYPVPQVSASLSCTPSVSVIILYPKCQCHYPVPQCQCHYPVPQVSVSLSCTPSVSVIILYPKCQCHYPVPQVLSAYDSSYHLAQEIAEKIHERNRYVRNGENPVKVH
ncbi:unnamed protein product [Ranitomeya imitator]|uniref:Uncharacterized protein n=1 Tax=Ranitomeya imitator TaxID=111125 RepID=A0ABN9KW92_9NEOB|nr:unnamed protein product [Ranitomeya imitator]